MRLRSVEGEIFPVFEEGGVVVKTNNLIRIKNKFTPLSCDADLVTIEGNYLVFLKMDEHNAFPPCLFIGDLAIGRGDHVPCQHVNRLPGLSQVPRCLDEL